MFFYKPDFTTPLICGGIGAVIGLLSLFFGLGVWAVIEWMYMGAMYGLAAGLYFSIPYVTDNKLDLLILVTAPIGLPIFLIYIVVEEILVSRRKR